MSCRVTKIPVATEHGQAYGYAIVCSRKAPVKRCVTCGTQYDIKLCDFPLTGEKSGQTCDRPVCGAHALYVEPDTDYCPAHTRLLASQPVLTD